MVIRMIGRALRKCWDEYDYFMDNFGGYPWRWRWATPLSMALLGPPWLLFLHLILLTLGLMAAVGIPFLCLMLLCVDFLFAHPVRWRLSWGKLARRLYLCK